MTDDEKVPTEPEGWRERYMHTIGAYNRIVEENKALTRQLEEQKILKERALSQSRHEHKMRNELLNEVEGMKESIMNAIDALRPYMNEER
jgi:hypothetical protein